MRAKMSQYRHDRSILQFSPTSLGMFIYAVKTEQASVHVGISCLPRAMHRSAHPRLALEDAAMNQLSQGVKATEIMAPAVECQGPRSATVAS